MSRLDWSDRDAVAQWLTGLRESFSDLDGAGSDMLRPPRKRRLGPALHASLYRGARAQIRMALDYAAPEAPHGDPSGNGGSPAE